MLCRESFTPGVYSGVRQGASSSMPGLAAWRGEVVVGRAPNEKIDKAHELFRAGLPLIEIATRLDIPQGTVRSWKKRYNWGCNATAIPTFKRNVAKHVVTVVKELDESNLTDKQKLFCAYYVKCFNATKAYQKAYGVDYATAASIAYRLLENDGVRNEIARLKQAKLNRAFLAPEDIFQKYMDIAFADITDYVEFGRKIVPVMGPYGPVIVKNEDTGEKIAVTKEVNDVRFKESVEVDGTILSEVKQGRDGASIKLADRMKALEWLADHMDLATEEQKARIAALKAKAQFDNNDDTEDDGFIDALKGTAKEVWADEE